MVDPEQLHPLLTDTDSAWSYRTLTKQSGQPDSDEFDVEYWCLWKEYILKLNPAGSVPSPIFLSQTHVLTIAAVFGRSLALLQSPGSPTKEAVELVRTPSPSRQLPLWEALKTGDRGAFRDFFLLASDQDKAFDTWRAVFDQLVNAGPYVPWFEIHRAATIIAEQYPLSEKKSPSVFAMPRFTLPAFPVSAAGLAKALKTDIPEIRRVLSGELPVGQTRLFTDILAVWRSRKNSPQLASLEFLKYLLFGFAVSFLFALKSPENTFFFGYCGLGLIALLSVYDFVKRRAWSTPPEWRISCAFYFTPFALPAAGLLLFLLAHLALIYALVRGTEPKVPT